ncbi:MAG: 23S rRNA (adenine(2503)-C(2))-methyltransferase RlmN [Bryobacteraceae bacterium]|nr:23S rRNA (adenine(2503)-C(2))-methyltransferase RlmN [Bryobacteraceae bacterium]
MTKAIVGLELAELEQALRPEPAYRARQVFDYVYTKRILTLDRMTSLPATLRQRLAAELPVGMPTVQHRYDSSDGTRRYLLDLADQRTVETVLMPQDDRDTICISSQVGCPVDCKFCLTALMGLERNLTAGEIVAQVLLVMEHNGLSPTDRRLNLVLMGMGEPLLNLPNVLKATRLLTGVIGIAPKRITLSTSGIIPKMIELGQAEVRPRLAISLNASYEAQRRELMPITKKYHLADLMETCRQYPLRKDEHLTFEYVLLKDVNDTDEDARRVVQLVGKLNCKVNLIALNPGPGIPFGTPTPERVASFQRIVRAQVPCYLRKPRGRDIYAACGQLKRMASEELVTLGG